MVDDDKIPTKKRSTGDVEGFLEKLARTPNVNAGGGVDG